MGAVQAGGDAAMMKRFLVALALVLSASSLCPQVVVPPGSLLADLGTCDASREGLIRKVSDGDSATDCNPTGTGDDTVECACIETSPTVYAWTAMSLGAHTADTNANTICTGTGNYLDGEGNCDALVTEAGFIDLDTDYGDETITSDFDFGGGILQVPNSITLPATCNVGDAHMDTDATTGQRWYLCESANTWAVQGDGTLTLAGSDNELLTDDGSGGIVSESTLVYDGTDFGIGDTTPDANLEVSGNGATGSILMVSADDAGNGDILDVANDGTDFTVTVKGSATQSGNVFVVEDSGGTADVGVNAAGGLWAVRFGLGEAGLSNPFQMISAQGSSVNIYNNNTQPAVHINGGDHSLRLRSDGSFEFASTAAANGTGDTFIGRDAAAILQQGQDSATPIVQTFKGPDGSGTDIAGADLSLAGGQGTGTGAGGSLVIKTAPAGSTGASLNALSNRIEINSAGLVGIGVAPSGAQVFVDQPDSSGVITVLKLDQGDIDDTFIDFIGTSAADGTRSISSDTTEDSAKFGAIRIEINGVTKWIRVYDDES